MLFYEIYSDIFYTCEIQKVVTSRKLLLVLMSFWVFHDYLYDREEKTLWIWEDHHDNKDNLYENKRFHDIERERDKCEKKLS